MKFDGWLFMTDMDGTILNENSEISDENAEAIDYFVKNGGRFTIASGRDHSDLATFFGKIRLSAPAVCMNGSEIYDYNLKKAVFALELPSSVDEVLADIYRDIPHMSIEIYKGLDAFVCRKNKGTGQHLKMVDCVLNYIDDYRCVPKPWTKVAFWDDEEKITELVKYVEKIPEEKMEALSFLQVNNWSCEILNKNSDKGYGLLKLREIIGGDIKIAAIGDYENDILMIKNADIGFAPSNACDKAKAAADFVLEQSCNESAVAAAIKKLDSMF